MPRVVLFRDSAGRTPLIEWVAGLPQKSREHAYASLERLRAIGHGLRRPESDYLVDGIYELRFRCERVNYRVLYFFHGRTAVIVSHGIIKQTDRVPVRDVELVRRRRLQYLANPVLHSHEEI